MMTIRGDRGTRRLPIIAGLSLMATTLLIAACQGGNKPAEDQSGAHKAAPPPSSSPIPAARAIAPVGRADILAAAAVAADDVAAGNPLPKINLELTNRTFEVRLPFGCSDGMSGNWGDWSFDTKTRVLRISVRPQLWGNDQTFRLLASGMPFDAAEGFWIERPWTRSEQCPPTLQSSPGRPAPASDREAAKPPASAQPRTLALVQYFSPDAPRSLRRGTRPYAYTAKLADTQPLATKGFRLKLTGRIRGFNDGQPIHCVVTTNLTPPTCAAAVEFTQVVLEDAETGESLTEWSR